MCTRDNNNDSTTSNVNKTLRTMHEKPDYNSKTVRLTEDKDDTNTVPNPNVPNNNLIPMCTETKDSRGIAHTQVHRDLMPTNNPRTDEYDDQTRTRPPIGQASQTPLCTDNTVAQCSVHKTQDNN